MPRTRPAPDPIALLKMEHRALARSLDQLARSTMKSDRRRRLLETVSRQLRALATMEEEVFYPTYRSAARSARQLNLFYDAREAHELMHDLLARLLASKLIDDSFCAKAKLLKDLVERHVGEEEGDLFPAARALLTQVQLDTLGVEMSERRRSIVAAA
jgi:hemerythrin-like domain-containing protein